MSPSCWLSQEEISTTSPVFNRSRRSLHLPGGELAAGFVALLVEADREIRADQAAALEGEADPLTRLLRDHDRAWAGGGGRGNRRSGRSRRLPQGPACCSSSKSARLVGAVGGLGAHRAVGVGDLGAGNHRYEIGDPLPCRNRVGGVAKKQGAPMRIGQSVDPRPAAPQGGQGKHHLGRCRQGVACAPVARRT